MIKDTLEKLMKVRGTSGDEYEVLSAIRDEIKDANGCEARFDNAGNLIVEKTGKKEPKKKLLFIAGTDEAGFIITDIDEKGFLRFECIGEMDPRSVIGKRVIIGENALPGLIGSKAIHLVPKDKSEKAVEIEDLYIDIGADTKEEAEKLVALGDRAVFDSDFAQFGEGFVMGRAADSRVCAAALVELLKSDTEYSYTTAFTVRSKIGGAGSAAAAFSVAPDIAVVISTIAAADFARSSEKSLCKMGEGAVLSFRDKGTAYDMELFKTIKDIAKANKTDFQICRGVGEKNECAEVHKAGIGICTASISVPVRYPNSPNPSVKLSDGDSMLELLAVLKKELCER